MRSFFALLIFVVLQRLVELMVAHENAKRMKARGGYEVGRSHYIFAVLLHTGFLISLTAEVVLLHRQPAAWWWIPFSLFILAQGLRYWCITSLGPFWNTRIIILPGAKLVKRGPYRFLRHPNYIAVVTELLAIPLIFQAYITAAVFTVFNAVFLSVRIPAEETALKQSEQVIKV